jgi:hypothetical protein
VGNELSTVVVAAVATGGRPDSPDAGSVLRAVFWRSIALAALVGLLVYAQAKIYPFTEMVRALIGASLANRTVDCGRSFTVSWKRSGRA